MCVCLGVIIGALGAVVAKSLTGRKGECVVNQCILWSTHLSVY